MMSKLLEAKRFELEKLEKQLELLEYSKTLELEEIVKVLVYYLRKRGFDFVKEKRELNEKIFSLKKRIQKIKSEQVKLKRRFEVEEIKEYFKFLAKNFLLDVEGLKSLNLDKLKAELECSSCGLKFQLNFLRKPSEFKSFLEGRINVFQGEVFCPNCGYTISYKLRFKRLVYKI